MAQLKLTIPVRLAQKIVWHVLMKILVNLVSQAFHLTKVSAKKINLKTNVLMAKLLTQAMGA